MIDWGFWIVVWLICGAIAAVISERKNLGAGSGFALGAFLGVIDVIIGICQKPRLPPAPIGMRAVKCTRCNADQNIHPGQTQFECCRCKTLIPLLLSGAQQALVPPASQSKPAAAVAPVRKSALQSGGPNPPCVPAVGAAVKFVAADDEHNGQIGTVQTFFDHAEDGLKIGVIFKGNTGIYAFGRNEIRVTQLPRPHGKQRLKASGVGKSSEITP